ncbi:hypothetical protein D9758_015670 [Tetrapyrgos nigripes]|uniref:Uncharacterized protein n=1 Tax=Tetrapyrgos nigripes TaxID=182062 RepID=A0A8H5C7L9_9AGAR|nr:hypothetical protein D9758_015670 [Tetrapyrgos nigripes]
MTTPILLSNPSLPAFFPVELIPNFIVQWAAVLPLVCHLATTRSDFDLVGYASLAGTLSPGIFPELGILVGIASLLKSPDYIELEGALGGTVWDVNWGSHFRSVNGAALSLVTAYALKQSRNVPIKMSERVPKSQPQTASSTSANSDPSHHRRYQTLHNLKFTRTETKLSWQTALWTIASSTWLKFVIWVSLFSIAVTLSLLGLYGTAVGVLCGIASQVMCHYLQICRPYRYLENNEMHDACMLVGSHSNCFNWYLCIGDRGIVDGLLNKPMLMFRNGSSGPWSRTANIFTFLHFMQLLAMTFAAANQGWDSIGMCILMVVAWVMHSLEPLRAVQTWLEKDGISIETKSFQFQGRVAMFGAVQIFSQTTVFSWMNDILTPHKRRNIWLKEICPSLAASLGSGDMRSLKEADRKWVEEQTQWSKEAAEVLDEEWPLKLKDARQ